MAGHKRPVRSSRRITGWEGIVSADDDGPKIRLWDKASGKALSMFEGPGAPVQCLAIERIKAPSVLAVTI